MRPPSGGQRQGSSPREIAIRRLAAGGDGVGSLEGRVIFVPRTAPGDQVLVSVVADRGSFLRGRLRELLIPSPQRTEPRCLQFGLCGGCCWQHLAYPVQLEAKRSIVEDALRRIGHLGPLSVPAATASPATYAYRHRVRLHVATRRGRTVFGFFRTASRDIVPVDQCPVLHPGLEGLFAILREAGRRHPDLFSRCGEVRADTDYRGRSLRLALRARDGESIRIPEPVFQTLRGAAGSVAAGIFAAGTAGRALALGPDGEALETTGESFTQVNLEQNRNLVRIALDLAAPEEGERVLDLYCGIGNLSLPAAARGASVLGIDCDPEAVRQAAGNARRLQVETAAFRQGSAAAKVRALAGERGRFNLIFLNPPRTGARETVTWIPALEPSRIVMVSCDPATFARDAARLREGGYRLAAVQPIDLFPQTAHVETVGLFTPTSSRREPPG